MCRMKLRWVLFFICLLLAFVAYEWNDAVPFMMKASHHMLNLLALELITLDNFVSMIPATPANPLAYVDYVRTTDITLDGRIKCTRNLKFFSLYSCHLQIDCSSQSARTLLIPWYGLTEEAGSWVFFFL